MSFCLEAFSMKLNFLLVCQQQNAFHISNVTSIALYKVCNSFRDQKYIYEVCFTLSPTATGKSILYQVEKFCLRTCSFLKFWCVAVVE